MKNILEKRYLLKDETGKVIETVDEMWSRVANHIAGDDKELASRFRTIMSDLDFLPNSPTLMNAGKPLGQLAACFVLPVGDSMEEIFDAVKYAAIIHKSGGGTGFSFSRLRPASDIVRSTKGVSSGPLSFMQVFNAATETVKQGGARRGANMAILSVEHPDIVQFIGAKSVDKILSNFNISVGITDRFMSALEAGSEYDLINPRNGKTFKTISAREVWEKIVYSAWKNGEPGIIFLDTVNASHPLGDWIESTNPCGEQPLLPYESCILGSINLSNMVRNHGIDYKKLESIVNLSVEFLDLSIDVNNYPLKMVEKATKFTRKIGIGVMGFADMLIKLDVPYASSAADELAGQVMGAINDYARYRSQQLGEEKGNFPAFEESVFFQAGEKYMRNATVTTIAPTGTISMIAGCSSGIEPLFGVASTKTVLDGTRFCTIHPLFREKLEKMGLWHDSLEEELKKNTSIQHLDLPKPIKDIFVTSADIDPHWHVAIQAAFQEHVDNAVSKTINFPKLAETTQIDEAFKLAYKLKCKGITVYRDGSREDQVITTVKDPGPRERPKQTRGITEKVTTGCGSIYVTINSDQDGICEIFANMGKAGGCPSSQIEATGRIVSLALRSGVEPKEIATQLLGIRCPSPAWSSGKMVLSCADAVAKVLKKTLDFEVSESVPVGACPECGAGLTHGEGCMTCGECGYSKCS